MTSTLFFHLSKTFMRSPSYIPCAMARDAFTLVELIVVIVILALLGTIWLVSFSWFNSNARDSTRIEDLSNIQKSLSIAYTTTGNKYPLPDNGVSVYSGWVLIQTQGYAGKNTLTYGKFNGVGQDPLDNQYYTYSVPSTQTGMELMAYLENSSNLTLTSYRNLCKIHSSHLAKIRKWIECSQ